VPVTPVWRDRPNLGSPSEHQVTCACPVSKLR
jgi:hypothetical protein